MNVVALGCIPARER